MTAWEVHPALVHFPIALLICALFLDLYAGWRHQLILDPVVTGLYVAGIAFGIVTALAGLLAFYTAPPAHTQNAHHLLYWHLGLAVGSVLLFTLIAWRRWARWTRRQLPPSTTSRLLSIVAATVLGVAAYLGGMIVYHGGYGIDPHILSQQLKEHHHHGGDHHAEEPTEHQHAE
jgi:uncharacterized membrane protein